MADIDIEERERQIALKVQKRAERKQRIRTNPIWIVFVFLMAYLFFAGILHLIVDAIVQRNQDNVSASMFFTLEYYTETIADILGLFILTWAFRDNRYIWRSFMLPRRHSAEAASADLSADDLAAEIYGRSRNSFGMLGMGLLLGFLTNFFCILCALIHGDIKLYLESSLSAIPFYLFALFSVCLQSTSEELWCRGFLYERLHEKYPLWFSIMVNGVLFGMLHIFNDGADVLPIVGICITGISYSLLRWYSGNIWIAMGIHTGWNFTQNYLFGLPNSGLVSEVSVFHLDAATGNSSLIYDYVFGVEGGLPALFIDAMLGVICVYLGYRSGRLGELKMSRMDMLADSE